MKAYARRAGYALPLVLGRRFVRQLATTYRLSSTRQTLLALKRPSIVGQMTIPSRFLPGKEKGGYDGTER